MSARADRKWAELARDLEFTRLPELRRQAEGWRNGLAGLTALLAVLGLLKGRDNLDDLPAWARSTATGLLVAAFLLLLTGSLLAVRAAHGVPGPEIVLGGQALRRWTEAEVARVTRALARAAVCCGLGLLLVVGTLALAWSTTEPAAKHLVRLRTVTGEVCGELLSADPQRIVVRGEDGGAATTAVPQGSLVSMEPAASCPAG
ncbi:hypothetical protein ACFVHB_03375 [Kitasatospora sp. NPDC127111]|uniref:hypothetical protein n=1 Tax=Kitasatospora sp. NPDC127111 TaxID=3345363 RepID=UPI0036408CEC